VEHEELLDFWFGKDLESPGTVERRVARWFGGDPELDREIARRFGDLPERAAKGELAGWKAAPRSTLALVIALDQLPRNLFRNSPRAYELDAFALDVALDAIGRGFDTRIHPLEATFLYLPLEHAEDLSLQERCVAHFTALVERAPAATCHCYEGFLEYACTHRDVVRDFGRFPHRNALFGRTSTSAERAFLAGGGATFGAGTGGEDTE
jgi:uncharacterized protein (DUF924 family)